MRSILTLTLASLNIFDAVATLEAVHFGVEEANPGMRALLHLSPVLFVLVKLFVVTAIVGFAGLHAPRWALVLCTAAYLGAFSVHVWGWGAL
jgi:hypothetical protein